MAKFYILIGPPGSGKSTWAREKCKEPCVVRLNRDELRTMMKGGYVYGDKVIEALCTSTTRAIARTCLEAEIDIIQDNTNCQLKTIKDILTELPEGVEVVVKLFEIPYWKQRFRCIVRWMNGGIWIPKHVSKRMHNNFQQVKEYVNVHYRGRLIS